MRRLLPVLILVLLGGCGGSDRSTDAGSDREQVEKTVLGYLDATADGDGDAACRVMSQAMQRDAATLAGAESCPAAVEKLHDALADEQRETLRDARLEKITIDGTSARATVAGGRTIPLEKAGGAWRLKSFPSGGGWATQAQAECVTGGMDAFERGQVDPFWRKEGRADYRFYIAETCRRADAKGLLDEDPGAEAQRIAGRVLLEMIQDGRVRDPR